MVVRPPARPPARSVGPWEPRYRDARVCGGVKSTLRQPARIALPCPTLLAFLPFRLPPFPPFRTGISSGPGSHLLSLRLLPLSRPRLRPSTLCMPLLRSSLHRSRLHPMSWSPLLPLLLLLTCTTSGLVMYLYLTLTSPVRSLHLVLFLSAFRFLHCIVASFHRFIVVCPRPASYSLSLLAGAGYPALPLLLRSSARLPFCVLV